MSTRLKFRLLQQANPKGPSTLVDFTRWISTKEVQINQGRFRIEKAQDLALRTRQAFTDLNLGPISENKSQCYPEHRRNLSP